MHDVRRIGGRRGLRGGPGKSVDRVFPERPQSFRHQRRPVCGRLQSKTRGDGAGRGNKGRNISWRNGSLQREATLDYDMLVCPNETEGTKERIAHQSKRDRAGFLIIVD